VKYYKEHNPFHGIICLVQPNLHVSNYKVNASLPGNKKKQHLLMRQAAFDRLSSKLKGGNAFFLLTQKKAPGQ